MPITPLTDEVRASAREKALLARTRRQEVKQALSTRELSVRQVLDLVDDDQALAKMPVDQMLRALPGIGAVRAEKLWKSCRSRRPVVWAVLACINAVKWWSILTAMFGIHAAATVGSSCRRIK